MNKLLNRCLALGCSISAFTLVLPASAQAQPIAQVKEIRGRVQRYIPPRSQLRSGDSLKSGDLIYVDVTAKAIVQCHKGQQKQLPIGVSSINNFCSPPLQGNRMPTRQGSDSLALRTVEHLNSEQRASLDAAIDQLSELPPGQRSLALAGLHNRFDLPNGAIDVLEASNLSASVPAFDLLGNLYWKLREDTKAEQAYRQALKLALQANDSSSSQEILRVQSSLLQIVGSYLESQQLGAAEVLLKELAQVPAPLSYQRELFLADLHKQRGELEQAAQAIDRAISQQPNRAIAYCYRIALTAVRSKGAQSTAQSISDRLRCPAASTIPKE